MLGKRGIGMGRHLSDQARIGTTDLWRTTGMGTRSQGPGPAMLLTIALDARDTNLEPPRYLLWPIPGV